MRILNDEENPYPAKPSGWFGSDIEAAIDYYAKREGWGEGAKAQYNQDIEDFIEWGNEECFEHPYNSKLKYEEYNRKRHRCPECWQSLKQLVGPKKKKPPIRFPSPNPY